MSKERPMIVTIMGDLNTLGAILMLLSFFPFLEQGGVYIQLPWYINVSVDYVGITKILYAIFLMIISYGYLKLKKWGYWLLVCKSSFSIVMWFIYYLLKVEPLNEPYPQLSIIGLIFLVPTFKYFYKKQVINKQANQMFKEVP